MTFETNDRVILFLRKVHRQTACLRYI